MRNNTINESLEELVINNAYEVAVKIKDDLNLSDKNFIIRGDSDELITEENLISIQFTYDFKVKSGNINNVINELVNFGISSKEIYIENHYEAEFGFESFYLDIDSLILLTETIVENKRRLMKLKGAIEYLVGKYSYNM